MSEVSSSKNITSLRTFASDLASVREKLSDTNVTEQTVPQKTEVVQQKTDKKQIVIDEQVKIENKPVQRKTVTITAKKEPGQKQAEVTPQKQSDLPQYGALSKEIEQVAKPQKESTLTDNNVYNVNSSEEGSIIRDTKRSRFRLIPAIISSVVAWYNDTKEAYKEAQRPKHTVAKAESRISTIKKAKHGSGQAPREDFSKVAEHLKSVERKPVVSTLTLTEKEDVPKPTWSYTDTGQPTEKALTNKEEKEVVLEETIKGVALQKEEVQKIETVLAEKTQENILQDKTKEVLPEKIVGDSEITDEIVVPQTTQNQEITLPEGPTDVTEVPEVEIEQLTETNNKQTLLDSSNVTAAQSDISEETPKKKRRYAPATNTGRDAFPLYVLIAVIVIASLLGIGVSYYIFAQKSTQPVQEKTTASSVASIIRTQSIVSFPLPQYREDVLSEIQAMISANPVTTQIYPTITSNTQEQIPAPTEIIVERLAPRTQNSFNRSIKEITFGGINGADPFIILNMTNFDIAFAGMLEWEKTLSTDLAPLFGDPVIETFDSSARTSTQVRRAFFKDVIASNKNVRLLLDENGHDRIIYTFINQNTIIITTTRLALEKLIPLVK